MGDSVNQYFDIFRKKKKKLSPLEQLSQDYKKEKALQKEAAIKSFDKKVSADLKSQLDSGALIDESGPLGEGVGGPPIGREPLNLSDKDRELTKFLQKSGRSDEEIGSVLAHRSQYQKGIKDRLLKEKQAFEKSRDSWTKQFGAESKKMEAEMLKKNASVKDIEKFRQGRQEVYHTQLDAQQERYTANRAAVEGGTAAGTTAAGQYFAQEAAKEGAKEGAKTAGTTAGTTAGAGTMSAGASAGVGAAAAIGGSMAGGAVDRGGTTTSTGEGATGGMLKGAGTGASIGAMTGNPVGIAVGAAVGAVVGGVSGGLKARARRKEHERKEKAEAEADYRQSLSQIEMDKSAKINAALQNMQVGFQNSLLRKLKVNL